MRDETRRKFDAELAKRYGLSLQGKIGAFALFVFLFCFLTYLVTPFWIGEKIRDVDATVTFAQLVSDTETGRYSISLQARLANGVLVYASGLPQAAPRIGEPIMLAEYPGRFWGVRYVWTGVRK
jgi:hypothetical protein